jgi:hypothetical protein
MAEVGAVCCPSCPPSVARIGGSLGDGGECYREFTLSAPRGADKDHYAAGAARPLLARRGCHRECAKGGLCGKVRRPARRIESEFRDAWHSTRPALEQCCPAAAANKAPVALARRVRRRSEPCAWPCPSSRRHASQLSQEACDASSPSVAQGEGKAGAVV